MIKLDIQTKVITYHNVNIKPLLDSLKESIDKYMEFDYINDDNALEFVIYRDMPSEEFINNFITELNTNQDMLEFTLSYYDTERLWINTTQRENKFWTNNESTTDVLELKYK